MSKFTKSEMKKSLLNGISLVFNPLKVFDWKWVEYDELKDAYKDGYVLFNEEKREFFEKSYLKF
jgi:hypothetical protein